MTRLMLLAAACLGGCACSQFPPADAASARVLIRFHQPTPGDAADVLANLSQVSGATVRYAAAVSDREYAYHLDCPTLDKQCTGAIHALRSWTARIDRIDLDEMKHIRQ